MHGSCILFTRPTKFVVDFIVFFYLENVFVFFSSSIIEGMNMKCVKYFNRNICWPDYGQEKAMKVHYSKQAHFNNRFTRDNT